MLGIAKFMDSTTLTHLEHPYKIKKKKKRNKKKKKNKVGGQVAYLQFKFAAWMWMGKSQ